MSKFEIGDRVEFTPVKADSSYPGMLTEYEGEVGTIVEADSAEVAAYWARIFGEENAIAGVLWDNDKMRHALPASQVDDPENRACYEMNLVKIEEAN